jgi:hypothetical protein
MWAKSAAACVAGHLLYRLWHRYWDRPVVPWRDLDGQSRQVWVGRAQSFFEHWVPADMAAEPIKVVGRITPHAPWGDVA